MLLGFQIEKGAGTDETRVAMQGERRGDFTRVSVVLNWSYNKYFLKDAFYFQIALRLKIKIKSRGHVRPNEDWT